MWERLPAAKKISSWLQSRLEAAPTNICHRLNYKSPLRATRREFVLVLVLVLDTPSRFAYMFSYFDYEDENDDEDDWNKPATRNTQLALSFNY